MPESQLSKDIEDLFMTFDGGDAEDDEDQDADAEEAE